MFLTPNYLGKTAKCRTVIKMSIYFTAPHSTGRITGLLIHHLESNWSYAFVPETKWREQLPKYSMKNFITSYTQCPAHKHKDYIFKCAGESDCEPCTEMPTTASPKSCHFTLTPPT